MSAAEIICIFLRMVAPTCEISDEFSLPTSTQNQSAMRERYLFMSYPYARSHGPAMFFMLGCQSSDTAIQVCLTIRGPCCAMIES